MPDWFLTWLIVFHMGFFGGIGFGAWYVIRRINPNYKKRWMHASYLLQEEQKATGQLSRPERGKYENEIVELKKQLKKALDLGDELAFQHKHIQTQNANLLELLERYKEVTHHNVEHRRGAIIYGCQCTRCRTFTLREDLYTEQY